ncbi:hypothetical protein GRZ55_14895 [Chelativorans sp. ZYF759]|uniref:hypothetical protein n=1 Tax=Chelativorans sp. ZYF759 TaxID=2692213 RepID=UPI00145EED4C|nr:hypothetical protein [Chelativorans sp. ZYF759]NMG40533.1 hypothetical protein [Chelativorans sp. ZYF759]
MGVEFPCDAPHPDARAQGTPRRTIPRLLWRAILALLRPAESAARRLIIAASRGIALPPPHPRKSEPKPQPIEPLLRRLGIAVMMAPANASRDGLSSPAKRIPAFPLFDPPCRLNLHGRRRRTVPPQAAPRIVVPGLTEPAPLPPPPSADDLISATRLTQRLAALAAALDDLPGQAKRFARWKARRRTARLPIRRVPPGGRLYRYDPSAAHPPNIREIDEILAHAHSLALHALETPDTS